ncbi:hypothetical protein NEMIN01_2219 [Nematocida minor]|uniref:uncharacterized protein n=1 Tax=Nematocida minor TaxID=1912983 RepID=UPI0022206499|nr:uncharacterized protein NEMIN01_2219 [Nematocida minor]KAI5192796.1 hypothetical protein NEMIN01_2219 [Nematocida minor]
MNISAVDTYRDILKSNVLSLSSAPIESVDSVVISITDLISDAKDIVFSPDEFLSLISLFNQRPTYFIIVSIFKILLKAKLDTEQTLLFLNCHQKQKSDEGPYSLVNWSFLEKSVAIKHTFITFLCKLVLNNKISECRLRNAHLSANEDAGSSVQNSTGAKRGNLCSVSSFDVIQVLFFLFDDENAAVRLKSYECACRIIKKEKQGWSKKERKAFKRALKYFGASSLKLLREEYRDKVEKEKEIKVRTTKLRQTTKIHIKMGQKIRKKTPAIRILDTKTNKCKEIITCRKNTIFYIKEQQSIELTISHKEKVLFEHTCSSKGTLS